MRPRVLLAWWAACLLWSATFLFIRIGLAEIPPFTFAWLRLAIALAVLGPLVVVRGDLRPVTRRDAAGIAAAGLLLLGVNYGLVFWGAQRIPSGLVAILLSATPLVSLGLGWIAGTETVSVRKIVSLGLAIFGVVVIFGAEARASGRGAMVGALAVFGGAVSVAAAYVWMKGYKGRFPPLSVTTIQCAAAIVPLACVALPIEGRPVLTQWSPSSWAALVYLGVGASVVAFWLNYWLLERMDTSAMLMMGVAEVPIAVALGALLLQERLTAGTLAGAACVLGAVIITLRRSSS